MSDQYDSARIEAFYDEYGNREWERLGPHSSPAHQVNFHLHNAYLNRFITSGWHVLEVGAGAGRFTLELARLGVTTVVADVSSAQLELNKAVCHQRGITGQVKSFDKVDVTNLSRYADEAFDAVVCYGGPLSYVFDEIETALREMVRVVRPGGRILLSVMSLIGSTQYLLATILAQLPWERIEAILATGDLDHEEHRLRMYRWSRLQPILKRTGCALLAVSSSGHLCLGNTQTLETIWGDEDRRRQYLAWELDICAEPGALDGGTHIIAVLEKPPLD